VENVPGYVVRYTELRAPPVDPAGPRRLTLALHRAGAHRNFVAVNVPQAEVVAALDHAAFTEPQLWRAVAALASELVEAVVRSGSLPPPAGVIEVSPTIRAAEAEASRQLDRWFAILEDLQKFDVD
jgi:hypothetical protein